MNLQLRGPVAARCGIVPCGDVMRFLLLWAVAGCGVSQDRMVDELVVADCAYALACFPDDVLTFYGWTDQETCEADHGPFVAARAIDCPTYDKKKAKACVKALRERSCQETPDPADFARPSPCDEVFSGCADADTDADTDL
jgi:hypothetical protein